MRCTPGRARARDGSMAAMRAWACGLRRTAAWSTPAGWMSSTKQPRPRRSRGSSRRGIRAPIVRVVMPRLSAEGRDHVLGEPTHGAQHLVLAEITEPEATVVVIDPHGFLQAPDLPDARVGRADDREGVEELVHAGLARRRHGHGPAVLHALVVV